MKSHLHSVIPFLPLFSTTFGCRLSEFSAVPPNSRTLLNSNCNQSQLLHDWRFTANQFVLATSPLRYHDQYFFQMNSCGCSPYVTSFLTRGWVCRLQFLLALASAVILGSHNHMLLSRIRWIRSLYLYPTGTGWPTGFLFVASYDSQGYGGGIRTHPHTGFLNLAAWDSCYIASGDPHRKHRFLYCCMLTHCCRDCLSHRWVAKSAALTRENIAVLFLCAYVFAGMCLRSRCPAMNYSGFQATCYSMLKVWSINLLTMMQWFASLYDDDALSQMF
jgi:hypothetical protein